MLIINFIVWSKSSPLGTSGRLLDSQQSLPVSSLSKYHETAAQATSIGYKTDLEVFEGSPHVGHMRLHPEQYWKKVLSAWKETQSEH